MLLCNAIFVNMACCITLMLLIMLFPKEFSYDFYIDCAFAYIQSRDVLLSLLEFVMVVKEKKVDTHPPSPNECF